MDRPLTDAERFPLLTPAGRERLRFLEEHPSAPRYNHRCGDRLDAGALARVRSYGERVQTAQRGWRWGEVPGWLDRCARFCLAEVPYYRRYEADPGDFFRIPTIGREELIREPWSFVPDSERLEDLIVYRSSQTSGECVTVLSHPEVPARDLPLMEYLLATRGVRLEGGSERVSIVMNCAQTRTLTYPMVSAYLREAGFAKINLNPADWRDPGDRVAFLDACAPELYSGDPVAFHELMQLPLTTRPKALLSTAMTLLPGFRRLLEVRFGCPVFDLYAMNEAGTIAADSGDGFRIVPHDLYVEILFPNGEPCEPGTRGEIVITGGNNPMLPLLRYRTGDQAAMAFEPGGPRLTGFEPRASVLFRKANGREVASHAVTTALQNLPVAAFALVQAADGSLTFRWRGERVQDDVLRGALAPLFGGDQPIGVEELPPPYDWGGKLTQYRSDEGRSR